MSSIYEMTSRLNRHVDRFFTGTGHLRSLPRPRRACSRREVERLPIVTAELDIGCRRLAVQISRPTAPAGASTLPGTAFAS